jgi:excisionase family DNA binding protein
MSSTAPIVFLAEVPAAPQPRALFSPKEAESVLGVSHATLYRLIAAGRIDARKLGGKTVVTAESISQLIAGLPRAACAA